MSLYHFHVVDGESYPDSLGSEFQDLEQARSEALRRTVSLIAYKDEEFWEGNGWKMIVTDEAEHILFTLNFLAVNSPLTQRYGWRLSN